MINQYRVFQIKEVHHQHWAKSYVQQVEDGFLIHHQNYQSAYKGKPAPSDTPMTARKRLEEKRPNTFIGRSFGVGDVIVWDEEKDRKFFYVDKEELVEFGGFMDADAAGNTVVYMVPNYQIDGKTGTWLPYDSEVVEGVCFFMMRNEQRKDLHCVTNHNGLGCSSHLISESKLAEVVLAALQGKVQQISGLEHRLDEINEIPKNERRLKSVEEHLKMLEQEEQKYQTLRRQLYEDMSSGIVSKEEYKEFSHSFNEKVETICKAKAEMNRQRDCLNNLDVEHLPWIEDFKSYQNLTSLNRRVLVELVESITVYDKEHIHIQYRFDQEIRNVLEYCSSVPAAETEESAV